MQFLYVLTQVHMSSLQVHQKKEIPIHFLQNGSRIRDDTSKQPEIMQSEPCCIFFAFLQLFLLKLPQSMKLCETTVSDPQLTT